MANIMNTLILNDENENEILNHSIFISMPKGGSKRSVRGRGDYIELAKPRALASLGRGWGWTFWEMSQPRKFWEKNVHFGNF